MIQKTLVLVKPDGVKRGLTGEVIKRIEQRGLKVVGLKMQWVDKDFAKKHYTDDITRRRGEIVRNKLIDFITEGPVVAIVIEGVEAIEAVRKIVGGTEPKTAQPGTIRGDFTHVSYKYADETGKAVKNIVHASADEKDAEHEIRLWFSDSEIYEYKQSHHEEVM